MRQVRAGSILPTTYVWKPGMADWVLARNIPEVAPFLLGGSRPTDPYQSQGFGPNFNSNPAPPPNIPGAPPTFGTSGPTSHMMDGGYPHYFPATVSDKSRVVAGVLNIVLPGVGRMYLGFVGIGVTQLLVTLCTGVGWIWSVVDGILMLTGNVTRDQSGRPLI